jgi:hypothetical protein
MVILTLEGIIQMANSNLLVMREYRSLVRPVPVGGWRQVRVRTKLTKLAPFSQLPRVDAHHDH